MTVEYWWYSLGYGWTEQASPPPDWFIKAAVEETFQNPDERFVLAVRRTPASLEEVPCLYWAMRSGEPLDPADVRVLLLVDEVGTIVVAGIVAKEKKNKTKDVRFWMILEAMRNEAERLGWQIERFKDIVK